MVAAYRIFDIQNVPSCNGEFPEEWKMTTVIPTPVYDKILELVVSDQVSQFCDRNKVFVECQSGFRVQNYRETVITFICISGKNEIVIAVFSDLRRTGELCQ
ncbi:hypothetical protein WA026_009335 [Henosepilachna vigintioctopunctata]|uniref:Reverse transcriptase domain-containing protein n=1 Tax=Henosepilachna vigintioctopunctata TaxID=420089 RepID=A0AAW1UQK8_9CUCU